MILHKKIQLNQGTFVFHWDFHGTYICFCSMKPSVIYSLAQGIEFHEGIFCQLSEVYLLLFNLSLCSL